MFRRTPEKQSNYVWSILLVAILLIVITQWFPIAYFAAFALFLVGFLGYKPTKKDVFLDILGLILLVGLLFLIHFLFFI
ncbi:hypothetical protein [Paenisporosarcina sp. OV554]|uniref:hypothetical protein n=1 Tax=Paenisporosarcina sp. OV554 TaxID=2135694 RepID=UPI000D33AC35|nr:hypothetical protein [Paenisporosarcina sp. OV554]PUB11655.1 hypothetical protein C8K15_11222 [Paenisporosarcina sp. OV554]